jgi:hypothetical protein
VCAPQAPRQLQRSRCVSTDRAVPCAPSVIDPAWNAPHGFGPPAVPTRVTAREFVRGIFAARSGIRQPHHRPDPLGAPPRCRHAWVRYVMTMAIPRLDRRSHGRGHPRVASGVPRSLVRARCIRRRALTRHVPGGPPPLARRRPNYRPLPTPGDPCSSSIAGRRASGFLQVSLSKVSRHSIELLVQLLAPRHLR